MMPEAVIAFYVKRHSLPQIAALRNSKAGKLSRGSEPNHPLKLSMQFYADSRDYLHRLQGIG